MKRVHIFISGKVQGVGFRWFVKRNASKRNIKGFVRNLYNGERAGQVECVFEGDEKDIEEMIELCKKGPIFSKVESVEVIEEEYKNEFNDFEIL
ncbi:MAG: acylphosphatase [Candidatus Altarchaeaceae archaeon]